MLQAPRWPVPSELRRHAQCGKYSELEIVAAQLGKRASLAGPLEPDEAWVLPGGQWPSSGDAMASLPTVTRAIPRRRLPPGVPVLDNVSQPAPLRYVGDELRFPPYTYGMCHCLFCSAAGDSAHADIEGGRFALAMEREVLIGFVAGHTAPAIHKCLGESRF